MSTLTFQLPNKLKERLTPAARPSGRTPARFVRETVEARLAGAPLTSARGLSLHDLSRDLCGSVSGGPRDLAASKNHMDGYGSFKR